MARRSQLEARITDALTRLSPEDMQRLAEDYARIRYPERFPRFDFRAFSEEGNTRLGWPDAWVCLDDRIDGVEATTYKSKSKVTAHLEEDLEKAIKRDPPLSGFIFVSGSPAVQLSTDRLREFRLSFIEDAGIDSSRLALVFGGGLVQELSQPEFTRTRIEVLQIRDSPTYFKLVRARLGPDEGRLDSDFIPSEEDYSKNRVHRPEAADQVLDHLRREGRALVRGVGASGKTVLAWLLALETAERRRPSYYLDLAGYAEARPDLSNRLIDDLQRFAHRGSLFILDNCHLDEALAKEVVVRWEEDLDSAQRPLLLLVGRELQTVRGSDIEGLFLSTIPLRARQPELRGVYRRLAARHYDTDTEPPMPPSRVLRDWVSTFGGDPDNPETTTDLIAFSAAVTRRLPHLLRRRWSLSVSDAVEEVREAYLETLSDKETRNLIRLAAWQEIEFALPHEALPFPRTGLRISARNLGLVFRETAGALGQYIRYRLAHAALGDLILAAVNETVDTESERRKAALQYPHLGGMMVGRLLVLGMENEAQCRASEILAKPQALTEMGSLKYLHNFLLCAQSAGIALPVTLGDSLAEATNQSKLAEQALQTPLHYLVSFLAYSEKKKALKPVFGHLAESLTASNSLESLLNRALEAPLDNLSSFLAYVSKNDALQPVFNYIVRSLAEPERTRRLAATMARQPLDALVAVMRSDVAMDLWRQIFTEIDMGVWEETRRVGPKPTPDEFVAFQSVAAEHSRSELARSPALRLVNESTPEEWQRPGIGLRHLSHAVRLATDASKAEMDAFLKRVGTPDWIDELVASVPSGPLAGSLLGFASVLETQQLAWLRRPSLERRIKNALQLIERTDTGVKVAAQSLALLGSGAAIGISLRDTEVRWPSSPRLAAMLRERQPDRDRRSIGPVQVQFWLGLREMARLQQESPKVPPKLAEPILILWLDTQKSEVGQTLPPHVRTRNSEIIDWLKKCRAAGWRLVPPSMGATDGTMTGRKIDTHSDHQP